MEADGTCPNCGRGIATAKAPARATCDFKLMVGAICIYLAWRLVQMISWLS